MLEDVEKVDDLKLNFQVWNKKTKGKHHPKALLMIRKDAPPVGFVKNLPSSYRAPQDRGLC